ncbi:MAG TPA: hypothetical protein VJJ21_04925 [Candidatus Nanoarchaeia archaeon]|nr:hypothetical protein [Candidatus Nanoarchaeia archaeon]
MAVSFRKGFTVYNKDNSIAIVAPHAGPALEITTSRDDNAETTASLLWKKFGGKLIVGNVSRKRLWGVDFNRDIPPLKLALKNYELFKNYDDIQVIFQYKKKYAWVAEDEQDYYERLKIYQGFWAEIEDCEKCVFIHRQFNRLKSLPGIMDFISLAGANVKKEKIYDIILDANVKYTDFFKRIEPGYKQAVYIESQRMVAEAIRRYKEFKWDKFSVFTREVFFKDLKIIKKYAQPYVVKRLQERFTQDNYIEACQDALKNCPYPRITLENTFDGSTALGPRRKLFSGDKVIIEVEPSQFMNQWYPDVAASIIKDVMDKMG